ncbi:hypothetical protein MJO28_002855, partial [Puccinia striiformis f. sp. tritici]
ASKPTSPTDNKPKETEGRPADWPDVTLSKTLSYILRHGPIKEKLEIRADGFIRLDGLLKRPKMENNTINDMKRVVARNVKQQFTIIKEEEADGTTIRYIWANQGHSSKVGTSLSSTKKIINLSLIDVYGHIYCGQVERPDLIPFTDQSELPTVVHGTYSKFWNNIGKKNSYSISQKITCIKPMTRTHIHFSKGLLGETGVVSVIMDWIYLDKRALFLISSNGVILSEGLLGLKKIATKYFKKIIKKEGTVLCPPASHES